MSEISDLTDYVNQVGGYDLHQNDLGAFAVPGWDGFPVHRFQYTKKDPDGTVKQGDIALLDPSPNKVATWVISAVNSVLGHYDAAKARQLVDASLIAGGFQFPVRGVHWENMTPTFTAYTFFDGVTVRLFGWNPSWPTQKLTPAQLGQALNATFDDVQEAMKWARIQSTGRQDYHENGGKLPTDGKAWLTVVRQCYQKAWNSDSNELMTAKARSMF